MQDLIGIVAINQQRELLLIPDRGAMNHGLAVPSGPADDPPKVLADLGIVAGQFQTLQAKRPFSCAGPIFCLTLATDPKPLPGSGFASFLEWVPLRSALSMVIDGEITDSLTVSGVLAAGRLHGLYSASVRDDHEPAWRLLDWQIAEMRAHLQDVDRRARSIPDSRIWKTLVRWAGMYERLRSGFARMPGRPDPPLLYCDEPAADGKPRGGVVLIRGWASADPGIDRVEVTLDGGQPQFARSEIYRPDLADRHGYELALDVQNLSSGVHQICIRAVDRNGRSAEITRPIRVEPGRSEGYARWIEEFDQPDPGRIQLALASLAQRPLISVITPVYKTNPRLLQLAIDSVKRQSYSNWELILVDDGSDDGQVEALLTREQALDKRIHAIFLESNQGIAAASNRAMAAATGEFVAQLDHDDELASDALFHVACAIEASPGADIFYSDEDHIDLDGRRSDPFFKPDWSPDLILGENYVCHLMVFRRSLANAAGGFRSVVDTAEDHDLLLRMSLRSEGIVHIPGILYHWRTQTSPEDNRRASFQADRARVASRRSVEEHLTRAGSKSRVEDGRWPGRWRIRYTLPEEMDVRILIAAADPGRLDRCLNSISQRAGYPRYSVAVANCSGSVAIESCAMQAGAMYLDMRDKSRSSVEVRNALAGYAGGKHLLLFLHEDTMALSQDWLQSMVELVSRPEVGAVGGKLLYPDGTIQHAGIVLGLQDTFGHAFRGYSAEHRIYYDFPDLVRNVSAVSGACLMTKADLFLELGGFDTRLSPNYAEVDFCLRAGEKGFRILYDAFAVFQHDETDEADSQSRRQPRVQPMQIFRHRWRRIIRNDPFYNPNLTRAVENYSLRSAADQ